MQRHQQRIAKGFLATGMTIYLLGGCAAAEEFRAATSAPLKSGLTTIATGLIDGIFAVFEPDATASTN